MTRACGFDGLEFDFVVGFVHNQKEKEKFSIPHNILSILSALQQWKVEWTLTLTSFFILVEP